MEEHHRESTEQRSRHTDIDGINDVWLVRCSCGVTLSAQPTFNEAVDAHSAHAKDMAFNQLSLFDE